MQSRFVFFIFLIAGSLFAARPLETDDAGTVDRGSVELELGVAFQSDSTTELLETPIGIKTGVVPGLDIGLGFGWQRLHEAGVTEAGLTDLEVGAKWNFLCETNGIPAMALTGAVKLPTADKGKGLGSGEADWDVTVVLSKTLTDRLTGHLNAGYGFIGCPTGEDVGDVLHGSAALELQVCESCWLTGEILAEREHNGGSDNELMGNLGLRWIVSDDFAFDTACGTSLNGGDTPDFALTFGLTWLFGS